VARTASPAPRTARALVRDLTGATPAVAGGPEVVLDPRPAYDFLLSLVGEPDAELLPADRDWLAASRASLSDGLKRDMALAFCHDDGCKSYGATLIDRIAENPSVRTSADVVRLVAGLGPSDLLAADWDPDDAVQQRALELGRRVLAGETGLIAEAIAAWPEESRQLVEPLLRDPEGYVRALRRVIRAWHERFEPIEARISRFEQRDADARRADLGRLRLSEFVELATGGVRWVPEPRIRRVLLAPAYFCRPYNWVFGGRDWHLFCYPASDTALEADRGAVPTSLLRLYRALGDESRLRILRMLADGDLYLTEIAERMGLSKATVSHHLALLRASGLVATTEAGTLMYFSLRRDRLSELGPDLARFLGPDFASADPAPTPG
jgi:DNA-binding transcriptional ArsR family regulator